MFGLGSRRRPYALDDDDDDDPYTYRKYASRATTAKGSSLGSPLLACTAQQGAVLTLCGLGRTQGRGPRDHRVFQRAQGVLRLRGRGGEPHNPPPPPPAPCPGNPARRARRAVLTGAPAPPLPGVLPGGGCWDRHGGRVGGVLRPLARRGPGLGCALSGGGGGRRLTWQRGSVSSQGAEEQARAEGPRSLQASPLPPLPICFAPTSLADPLVSSWALP